MNPVSFDFKDDPEGKAHVGFIAEDAPKLIATKDRQAVTNDHITAILAKVVKEQHMLIKDLAFRVQAWPKHVATRR